MENILWECLVGAGGKILLLGNSEGRVEQPPIMLLSVHNRI